MGDRFDKLLAMSFHDKAAEIDSQLTDITHKISYDFCVSAAGAVCGSWLAGALSTGTAFPSTPTAKHPGCVYFTSSTNANSGYRYYTFTAAIMLGGGEKTTIIFKTPTNQTTVTRRMGFHTSVDYNAPVDGVYGNIADGVLTGKTSNNSTASTTASDYTLANGTWYRLVIELNADATLATYTLYADDSDTILWTDTLATNIPKTRAVGHSDIVTSSGTSALYLGDLDYLDIVMPNARRV